MSMSISTALMFLVSIIFQVSALALLPLTKGYSNVVNSIICSVLFVIGIALLARIISTGVRMSILIPLSAAAVPIAIVGVSLVFYGEPASALKIALLLSACGIIGLASTL